MSLLPHSSNPPSTQPSPFPSPSAASARPTLHQLSTHARFYSRLLLAWLKAQPPLTLATLLTLALTIVVLLLPSPWTPPVTLPATWHRLLPPSASLFAFSEREPGNLARITSGIAPRDPPLARKPGLIAVPVGIKSLPVIAPVLQQFHAEGFDVIVFHYDAGDAVWAKQVPEYKHWAAVSAHRQSKFWFAKRFLTPAVVDNYDYLFLWDDDFVQLLKDHHIHVGQPALLSGTQPNWQKPLVSVHNHTGAVGRFTSFVEVMFPVFSRAAWPCAWRLLPYDGVSFWGADNAWYPVCASHGMCRFAVMDAMPVHHLDKRSLGQNVGVNLRELEHYRALVHLPCDAIDKLDKGLEVPVGDRPRVHVSQEMLEQASHPVANAGAPVTVERVRGKPWEPSDAVRRVCRYLKKHPFAKEDEFYSIRNLTLADRGGSKQCPEPAFFDVKPVSWWGPEESPPPKQTGYWVGREEELEKVRKIKLREIEERKKSGGKNKGSW
ncbi:hypothetical protein BCR44DRAFT_1436752 [Catenaria anguillulae PL171]|uniref:Uncharacterized protein n=1 Tax=Catenaria anguillulae PL171 TaxID=765915 RepID=A0A1Y2HK14_9FUNG|nr:hypothetical protein BCR44DRAFT_1436752 [Catenaria anguillulae PL171]